MNPIPFLLAAALIPRDQWHECWKYINRLAGIVAERSQWPPLHGADRGRAAQALVDEIAREFTAFLAAQETDGVDVTAIRSQERELINGLTKRVAECLMLGACEGIDEVRVALDAIRRTKEMRT